MIIRDSKVIYRWVLPISSLVFIYLSISSFQDASLIKEDLVEVKGKLSRYELVDANSKNGGSMILHISNGNSYLISYNWKEYFPSIKNMATKSREITLYHRTADQARWKPGNVNLVYQFEMQGSVIIDLAERKKESVFNGYFMGIIAGILSSFLLFRISIFFLYKK